jgi:hypothetical protein
MNEGDKFFARESAVLYEFLELVRRALLVEADERKMPNMFDSTHSPKPRVSVETLEESVKNGLPLHLAVYSYDQIERTAREHVHKLRRKLSDSYYGLIQVRAKHRGEEFESKSQDQIALEASRWVNDIWSEAVEHQAVM